MKLRGWLKCLGAVQIGSKRLFDHVHSHNSVLFFRWLLESSLVILSFYELFDSLLLSCLLWSMLDHSSSLDKQRHSLNKYGIIESFHDDPNATEWQCTVLSQASRHRAMTRYVRMKMMERTHHRMNTAQFKTRSICFSAGLKNADFCVDCTQNTSLYAVRTHTRFFLVRTKHVMTARVAPDCQVLRVSQNHFISDHVSLECSALSFSSDSLSLHQLFSDATFRIIYATDWKQKTSVPLRREVECLAI